MRLSLRTRILLLIAGTVTGLAVLALCTLMVLTRREIDRAVQNDVRTTGGVLTRLFNERSRSLRDQSLLLARQPALMMRLLGRPEETAGGGTSDAAQKPDFATVTDSLQEWLKQMHADSLRLTDEEGHTLGDTEAKVAPVSGQSLDAGVKTALEGESWAGIALQGDRLKLSVTVPVQEPVSKYVRGTFTASSLIDAQAAKELKNALGSDLAFVHQGRVIGASLPLPDTVPTPQEKPQVTTLNGTDYFALYAPLPDTDPKAGVGFVTLRPYNTVMSRYGRLRNVFMGVSVVTLTVALALGAALARSLTRPLDGLVRAAQVMQGGGWPDKFATRRSDEIGLLQTVFDEMTEAMQASREHLLGLIDSDPLTGLHNHRFFQERLTQETSRSLASGEALSLLLIDLDHFHQFNLERGHAAGDEALQQLAILLKNILPEVAIRARYGGEEFATLLPLHTLEQAAALGERIRALVEKNGLSGGQSSLTVSVGCVQFETVSTNAEGLILAGELAVSRAKQLGRNRICCFDNVQNANGADPFQLYQALQSGSLITIQALAAAVDAKDPYTQGHSQRVAEYATELARYLGLPQTELDLVFITGTLHDVGKIGIPDAILKKPGRLEDEEREIMETHPVLGEVIVRKVPQLVATLPGVRHHHERWDGKGYPDRLAGESIPSMARILAVADTYDAMTSDRPYRKGLAVEIALGEILKGAGTQFDPELSPAFVAMMEARAALSKAA